MEHQKAFAPARVGGIDVKNRIVRSATHEGTAKDNTVSDGILAMHRDLAEGGVGLIITGYVCVSKTDNPGPTTVTATFDSCIDGLRTWADTVHGYGSKIVAQLNHATTQIFSKPQGTVYGPSAVADPVTGITPVPFTTEQVKELVREFGDAAYRLKTAGFDGVQIHGAHGYLVNRFLSPAFNTRDDEYGGSPENNRRLAIEILSAIKSRCGADFPVWIKLNGSDFAKDGKGFDRDMFLALSRDLAENGINAIEVSGGTLFGEHSPSRPKSHTAYHLDFARDLLKTVDVPVILVGGLRNINTIETLLSETGIQAVALSRSLIREPALVNRWMNGDLRDAECVSCNGCFNPKGTRCFFHLSEDEKAFQKRLMKLMGAMGKKS
jgi:2,4-dienoyl-CoA reductase-like NADH-dependent reductase (Old Yellow Enzyme family)